MNFLFRCNLYFIFPLILLCSISLKAQETSDSTFYGNVVLNFNTDSALAIINNNFQESKSVNNHDTLRIKSGLTSIKLSVINDYLFEKIFVLKKDSTVVIDHKFKNLPFSKELINGNYALRKALGANLLIITDDQSDIILNDTNIGKGYAFTNGNVGENNLEIAIPISSSSSSYSRKESFSNSDLSFKIVEKYVKPKKGLSKKLAFIPGASQTYKYQNNKASFIKIGLAISIVSVSTFELKYRKNRSEFNTVLVDYQQSPDPNEVTKLGNRLDVLNDRLESDALFRNVSVITLASIYLYNIFDGIFTKPVMGYRDEKPLKFYFESNEFSKLGGTFQFSIPSK